MEQKKSFENLFLCHNTNKCEIFLSLLIVLSIFLGTTKNCQNIYFHAIIQNICRFFHFFVILKKNKCPFLFLISFYVFSFKVIKSMYKYVYRCILVLFNCKIVDICVEYENEMYLFFPGKVFSTCVFFINRCEKCWIFFNDVSIFFS